MRYTTVLDITSAPWYRNKNVVLVYLHMSLTCGYHDDDRDLYTRSIRSLAIDSGMTLSATRHALQVLQRDRILTREGNAWRVKKWLPSDSQTVTPRPKTEKAKKLQDIATERRLQEERNDALRQKENADREKLRNDGKTPYMLYYESKVQAAENGDLEAAEIVRKNRHVYLEHKRQIEEENKKKK